MRNKPSHPTPSRRLYLNRGMIITRPILKRFSRCRMRWDAASVVPAVILKANAAVSVAAPDGGFADHIEVFDSSVFLVYH